MDRLAELFDAIMGGDIPAVKGILEAEPGLLARGATEPRLAHAMSHWIYKGDTALHVAAAAHRAEMVEVLLKAGADVNVVGPFRAARPLHYAADGYVMENFDAKAQVAVLRRLIEAGAQIDAQDKNGATALHRAVRTRCAAAVEFLLSAGADFRVKNKPGSMAFHLAAQNTGRGGSGSAVARAAQSRIIESFLAHKASPQLRDARGKTVLDWAKSDWVRDLLVT